MLGGRLIDSQRRAGQTSHSSWPDVIRCYPLLATRIVTDLEKYKPQKGCSQEKAVSRDDVALRTWYLEGEILVRIFTSFKFFACFKV